MPSNESSRHAAPSADILDVLRRDHLRVDQLLDQIEGSDESDERRRGQLFAQVAAEIDVHSDAEDQVVYSALESRAGFEDLIEGARQEHEHIEQMVEELDEVEAAGGDWRGKVRELRRLVRHHIDEEETRLFGMIREALSTAERAFLAQDFIAAKEIEEEDSVSGEFVAAEPPSAELPSAEPGSQPAMDEQDIESLSKKELYDLARSRHIEGRSAMTKAELVVAIRSAK